MKKISVVLLSFVVTAAGTSGCSKSPGNSSTATTSTSPAAQEKIVYLGDLELSKKSAVTVAVEETNECTITTMVLPGGNLNLDIAVETKGAATSPPHINVPTRVGQEFTFPVGNLTVGYTAKLKAE